jgi:hypothetical protein
LEFIRALHRLLIWLGLTAEKATETDAINEAVVERGIRDSRAKADKAHQANGQIAAQISLLTGQYKLQEGKRDDMQSLLQAAARANDSVNGASYADQLATIEEGLNQSHEQIATLTSLYNQNTQIIANSLRAIQQSTIEFENLKAKVQVSRSLEQLSGLMKGSITELQGMVGTQMNQSMDQLRQSAASGEGQMRATLDLAKAMGSDVRLQQDARAARGAQLFQEYQQKMGLAPPAALPQTAPPKP